jgi:hypothetical protein
MKSVKICKKIFYQNRPFFKNDLIFIKLELSICYYIHEISFVMYFKNICHMTSSYSQIRINLRPKTGKKNLPPCTSFF